MFTKTRGDLVRYIEHGGLDEFDREDAVSIVDVLMEAMTPFEVLTWICWPDDTLEGTPLVMIREGRGREVLLRARRMVAEMSS